MKSSEFVAKYDRETAEQYRLPPDLQAVIQPADDMAFEHGRLLHDALSGKLSDGKAISSFIQQYHVWTSRDAHNIAENIDEGPWTDEEKTKAGGVMHFHALNQGMSTEWWIINNPNINQRDRNKIHTLAQDTLAINALHMFFYRERRAGIQSAYSYFREDSHVRAAIEGEMNEIDSAIVMLEAAKRNNMFVLPAPPQFERTNQAHHNVDFVIVDGKDQVVGVQVKSKIHTPQNTRYDDDIVLIDAAVDLENQLAKRTEMYSSNKHVIGWAGLIAAHQILRIPTVQKKGNERLILSTPGANKKILSLKMKIRDHLKGIPDRLPQATKRIEQRLKAQLQLPGNPARQ